MRLVHSSILGLGSVVGIAVVAVRREIVRIGLEEVMRHGDDEGDVEAGEHRTEVLPAGNSWSKDDDGCCC